VELERGRDRTESMEELSSQKRCAKALTVPSALLPNRSCLLYTRFLNSFHWGLTAVSESERKG